MERWPPKTDPALRPSTSLLDVLRRMASESYIDISHRTLHSLLSRSLRRSPWPSPEGEAGKARELLIGREQHQALQFRLGGQHAIKGIAVRLAVGAGPKTVGQCNGQGLEPIGLKQNRQIADGLRQFRQLALMVLEAQLPNRGCTHQHRGR